MCHITTYRADSHCCIPLISRAFSLILLAVFLAMYVSVASIEIELVRFRTRGTPTRGGWKHRHPEGELPLGSNNEGMSFILSVLTAR